MIYSKTEISDYIRFLQFSDSDEKDPAGITKVQKEVKLPKTGKHFSNTQVGKSRLSCSYNIVYMSGHI